MTKKKAQPNPTPNYVLALPVPNPQINSNPNPPNNSNPNPSPAPNLQNMNQTTEISQNPNLVLSPLSQIQMTDVEKESDSSVKEISEEEYLRSVPVRPPSPPRRRVAWVDYRPGSSDDSEELSDQYQWWYGAEEDVPSSDNYKEYYESLDAEWETESEGEEALRIMEEWDTANAKNDRPKGKKKVIVRLKKKMPEDTDSEGMEALRIEEEKEMAKSKEVIVDPVVAALGDPADYYGKTGRVSDGDRFPEVLGQCSNGKPRSNFCICYKKGFTCSFCVRNLEGKK